MFSAIARPFGMLLMFLYEWANNYGIAIILIALIIKVILLPFQMKSKRGMIQQAKLQPKVAELQKKHGTNKQKINEETMKLYKEAGVSPASGCLWGFLPLPIMLALFQAIRQPITMMMGVVADNYAIIQERLLSIPGYIAPQANDYYKQITESQWINNNWSEFLKLNIENLRTINFNMGIFDFSLRPQWDYLWNANVQTYGTWFTGFVLFLIPLISGGMQFLASAVNKKMNPPMMVEGQAKQMNTMLMLMPLFSVYIGFITPAALGFYWTISTILQVAQDIWLTKVYTKKLEAEEAVINEERQKKEAEIEAKRLETERRKAEGLVERNPNTSKSKKQKSEKQEQIEKAVEWQKKNAPPKEDTEYEPSREGKRRYARGRAYIPDRYERISEESEEKESEHPRDMMLDDNYVDEFDEDELSDGEIGEDEPDEDEFDEDEDEDEPDEDEFDEDEPDEDDELDEDDSAGE